MLRDPRYEVLFEPVEIGPRTMPNRFYKTPHCRNFAARHGFLLTRTFRRSSSQTTKSVNVPPVSTPTFST